MFANNLESLSLYWKIIAFMWLHFLFVFFSVCGLRDAGILDDLGRSNSKDSQAHLLEDNPVRFFNFSPGKRTRQ